MILYIFAKNNMTIKIAHKREEVREQEGKGKEGVLRKSWSNRTENKQSSKQ